MSFTVTLRPSGRAFTVDGDETVLAAALRAGVLLPYGCRTGTCGACKCTLLQGALDYDAHSASALSPAEQAAGKALVCCSHPRTDLELEVRELAGVGALPARRMPARIVSIERAAPDVAIVRLQLPASERLQYLTGQYLDLLLRDGHRRSYSIATPPHHDGPLELHIRHLPGGLFTDALFGATAAPVKERDIVRVEAPLGTFYLREDSTRPIVLLAGGTGFAPIKAIAEHVFERRLNRAEGARAARPVHLYWGARRPHDLYADALPREWAATQPNLHYVPVLSESQEGDGWTGRSGLVHQAVLDDIADLAACEVYACGAPGLIAAAQRDFTARGLPPDQFFADAFTSAADLPPAA